MAIRLGVVGAGTDGRSLLELLLGDPRFEVVVVVDRRPDAAGAALARTRGIPVVGSPSEVFRHPLDFVIEVTGDPEVLRDLRAACPAGVEVIGAAVARLLWELVVPRQLEATRLRALIPAIHALGQELSVPGVLERIAREVAGLVGDAVVKLWLRSEAGDLRLAASADARPGADPGAHTLPRGRGLSWEVVGTGKPLAVEDVHAEPRLENVAWMKREGLVSFGAVPLRFGDEVLGALVVFTRVRRVFSAGEIEILSSFGMSAAVAIRHAQILEDTTRVSRAFESLAHVTRSMVGLLEAAQVFRAIVEAATDVLGADAATLSVYDEASETLAVRADFGLRQPSGRSTRVWRLGEGVVGWVAQQLQPVFLSDFAEDPRVQNKAWARAEELHAYGAIPLRAAEGRLVGVLTVFFRRPHVFTDEEIKLFHALAGLAAVAIVNAGLYADLHRALETVRASQERQIELERLRALGEMASGIAHHFNNMLAAILGRTQLLLRRATDPKVRDGLQIIEKLVDGGAQTVRRVQEFAGVRRRSAPAEVQLNELVSDALELTRTRWESEAQAVGRDYHIERDLASMPPVRGEAAELREVLVNLFLNAFDAMPEGGRLRVVTRRVDQRVEIRIADSGQGMTEEVRRRALEPFFTTKGPKSSGLGLAMAYGVVERYGGTLEIETKPGAGTTVVVTLPAASVDAGVPAEPRRLPGRAPRVLVAEDEVEVRDVLVEALIAWGYDVVATGDGTEAARLASDGTFDLVVTDVSMPGRSGWVVAEAVRSRSRGVPIVFVTGWGDQLDPERLAALDGIEVVSKPFRLEALRNLLTRVAGLATP